MPRPRAHAPNKQGGKPAGQDTSSYSRISSMGTFEALAFDVAAALVQCGLNALVSTPDDSIIKRIHLEIVSLETGL